ncbi:hypothetical protein V1478_015292 [Vespula squamosa]|uniref:Uncharacterized protein n=1 Tax=Vespula squamosa TaxID=30214 RepID=A0ABD2A4P6_VESSQ
MSMKFNAKERIVYVQFKRTDELGDILCGKSFACCTQLPRRLKEDTLYMRTCVLQKVCYESGPTPIVET